MAILNNTLIEVVKICVCKRNKSHTRKYCDNCDDNEKFNESKSEAPLALVNG